MNKRKRWILPTQQKSPDRNCSVTFKCQPAYCLLPVTPHVDLFSLLACNPSPICTLEGGCLPKAGFWIALQDIAGSRVFFIFVRRSRSRFIAIVTKFIEKFEERPSEKFSIRDDCWFVTAAPSPPKVSWHYNVIACFVIAYRLYSIRPYEWNHVVEGFPQCFCLSVQCVWCFLSCYFLAMWSDF